MIDDDWWNSISHNTTWLKYDRRVFEAYIQFGTSTTQKSITLSFHIPISNSLMSPQIFSASWLRKPATALNSALVFIVFLIFDFLDAILCILYRYIDHYFEGFAGSCYCGLREIKQVRNVVDDEGGHQLSETLYRRKNVFREMGLLGFAKGYKNTSGGVVVVTNRWSDCGCQSCLSWVNDTNNHRLHLVIRQPSSQGISSCSDIIFVWFLFMFNSWKWFSRKWIYNSSL